MEQDFVHVVQMRMLRRQLESVGYRNPNEQKKK